MIKIKPIKLVERAEPPFTKLSNGCELLAYYDGLCGGVKVGTAFKYEDSEGYIRYGFTQGDTSKLKLKTLKKVKRLLTKALDEKISSIIDNS